MIDETWYHRPHGVPEHVSAGGVVVRIENHRLFVAVTGQKGRPRYVLPKGQLDPGETLEQAAVREIKEETGLANLKLIELLGVRERLDFRKTAWKKTHYFLFTTDQVHGIPTDDKNHDEVKWFPLEAFPDLFWPEQTQLVRDNRERIDHLIWNATRRVD